MSLDQLMNMDMVIVSASKTNQIASDSAAAIFVISKEDIRRSGANHIADVLRMAPGITSVKIGSSEWVTSARGFTGKFIGDLLVLIDGRSVFSSLQNTVSWEEQNIHLNNIERIEVIRGPGGSLWGANAVNGIINIITKDPTELNGTHISASVGEGDKQSIYASHGGTIGSRGSFGVTAHQSKREGYLGENTGLKEKDWDSQRLRIDAQWGTDDHDLRLTADAYEITTFPFWPQYTITPPFVTPNDPEQVADGYAIQGKWSYSPNDHSSFNTRISIDKVDRESLNFHWDTDNIDLDLEWNTEFNAGHQLGLGINSRQSTSFWETFEFLDIDAFPPEIDIELYSVFAQYTHFFTQNFRMTIGAKTEHHSEVGETLQPTLKALWIVNDSHRFWSSISKSNAIPSRIEYSPAEFTVGAIPPSPATSFLPALITFSNDGSITDSQELVSTQLGYRFTPTASLNVDIAGFYNEYENRANSSDDITTVLIPGTDTLPTSLELQTSVITSGEARTHGLEIATTWKVNDRWKLQYSGTFFDIDDDSTRLTDVSTITRNSSDHWHSLRSLYNISRALQFDIWLRHTDEVTNQEDLTSYTTADIRLGWNINENVDLSLTGRNLFEDEHAEFRRETFYVDNFLVEETYSIKLEITF